MHRKLWLITVLIMMSAGRAESQTSARVGFDSAQYAWQAGRYVEALGRLERLLTGPTWDSLLAPIAQITGEPYRTW